MILNNLTVEILMFWIVSHLLEVTTYQRWSYMEVELKLVVTKPACNPKNNFIIES